MTSQMNSPHAFKFVCAIAVICMVAVAGSVGAGNGSVGAGNAEPGLDVWTMMTSADIASLPTLHIEDPI